MNYRYYFIIIILLMGTLTYPPEKILATNSQQNGLNLKRTIDEKTEELKKIHRQIQKTQDNLFEVGRKKKTLKQELKRFNYKINQLKLSIRSNKINIEKLGLEINQLNQEIADTQKKIKIKNQAINEILRKLQIKDDENLIITFLKNQSLADSLATIHNLTTLRHALINDVDHLRALKQSYDKQFKAVANKKRGVEKEHQIARVRKSLVENQRVEKKKLLTLTKNQEKLYEKLIDELAERQIEIAQEIEVMEARLRKQIDPGLLPQERPGVLGWPIEKGYKKVTQNYGSTKFARYGYKGHWHNGIDIGAPMGSPILTAGDGLVVNTGNQDKFCRKGAYGKYVVIRHNNNLVTLYGHLSKIAVEPGDIVNRGEIIGYVGTSGYSTGPHVHFTVYDGKTFQMRPSRTCGPMPSGGDINPRKYL